jgi:integrase
MLYRRRGTTNWWCRFSVGHREVRQSCGTADRKDAEEFEERLRARIWREVRLGERSYSWEQAVDRWLKDARARPSTTKRNATILEWFAEPLAGLKLTAITPEVVAAAKDALLAQKVGERPISPSTANRYLAVLRAVLNHARAMEWVRTVPKVALLEVEDREPRWLTREQFARLLTELPPHLRAPAQFAVLTGLRLGNVQQLVWGRVNLETAHVWIPASTAKGRKAISVPLSPEVVELLRSIERVDGQDRVFLYRGIGSGKKPFVRPMGCPKRAFGKAVKRAGVAPFRWHDLRHTWASWMIQEGVPAYVVQHLGGWASGAMVQKYAHLDSAHLRQWVERTKSGTGPR